MKPKNVVTATLLLFVAVSVVYMVAKEMGGKPSQSATQPVAASTRTGRERNTPPYGPSGKTAVVSGVVAYYFHGNMRCKACRTIEAYAAEAVKAGFPEAIRDGRLEWRVINVDEPGNDHYVQDFQLITRSVVLERLVDGKRRQWKNLRRVWELVRGDKDAFLKYVRDETRSYLEAAGE